MFECLNNVLKGYLLAFFYFKLFMTEFFLKIIGYFVMTLQT